MARLGRSRPNHARRIRPVGLGVAGAASAAGSITLDGVTTAAAVASAAGSLTLGGGATAIQPPADTYGALVYSAGPSAYYRLDGSAADVRGGNSGVLHGAPAYSAPLVGGYSGAQALTFNGSTDYLAVPDDAGLNPTTAGTLECWLNLTATVSSGDGFNVPLSKYDYGFEVQASTLRVGFFFGSSSILPASPLLTLGSTAHLVATWDGATVSLYVNGALVGTAASSYAAADSSDLFIGGYNNSGTALDLIDGAVDEVAVYTRALSAAEVGQHYTTGATAVAASAAGSITLGGVASATAPAVAAGTVTLGGAGTARATGTTAGSLTLGGTAAATAPAAGTGTVTLGGSSSARASAGASGAVTLAGTATASSGSTASGSITLGGTAAGQATTASSGAVTLSGTSTAAAATSAAGSVALGGTASPRAGATAVGTVTLSGTATGAQSGTSAATGTVTLGGTATATAAVTSAGSVTLGGSATSTARVAAAGGITLAGAAQLAALGNAAGVVTLAGLATAQTAATATGGITLAGQATGQAGGQPRDITLTVGPLTARALAAGPLRIERGLEVGALTARDLDAGTLTAERVVNAGALASRTLTAGPLEA